jgi:large subunit ribosomal protein L32
MGQPKRKQSKQRSRKRRGASVFSGPQLAKDPATGDFVVAHRVNPKTGIYRGRQVIDIAD